MAAMAKGTRSAADLTERVAAGLMLALAVVFGYATIAASLDRGALAAGDDAIHSALTIESGKVLAERGRFFDWSYLYGLGSPMFIFRPPGFYAVVHLLHLGSGGLIPLMEAHKLAFAIGFMLYPLAVFYLLRKFRFSPLTCGFGALLALAPVSTFGHTLDAYYDLGMAKQLFAILLFPFALGKLHGIVTRGERLFPGMLLFGLVFINHPYLAWSLTLVGGIYLLVHALSEPRPARWLPAAAKTGAVIVAGTLLSAFWLVPLYRSGEIQPVESFSSAFRSDFDVRTETAATLTRQYLDGSLLDRTAQPGEVVGKGSVWAWRDNSAGKRWPVLSWCSLLGLAVLLARRPGREAAFFAAGWIASVLIFLGPDDIPLLRLIPFQDQFQYVHFVAILELFAVCLAAVGAAAVVDFAWRPVQVRLAKMEAGGGRQSAAFALLIAVGALCVAPALAERYEYGRSRIRNRRFEVQPSGQTAWSLQQAKANQELQKALAFAGRQLTPFGRVYARAADIHRGVDIFHFTLAPAYFDHGNLVSPLLVGADGGVNSIVNSAAVGDTLWTSPAFLELFGVGALITGERDQPIFPFAPAAYAEERRFPPWVVYAAKRKPLPFGVSTARPILVVADARMWQRTCIEWMNALRGSDPARLPQTPWLVWQPPDSPLASPPTPGDVQAVYVADGIEGPAAALSPAALGAYAAAGGTVAAAMPSPGAPPPAWATRTVRGVGDLMAGASAAAAAEPATVSDIRQRRGVHSAVIDTPTNAIAYFKAAFYRGWRVRVDGRDADNVPVSPGFNACRLGPGQHTVEFRYRGANGARAGGLLTLFALTAWPAEEIALRIRRRRRGAPAANADPAPPASGKAARRRHIRLIAPALAGLVFLAALNARQRVQGCPVPTGPLTGDVVRTPRVVLTWNPLTPAQDPVHIQIGRGDRRFGNVVLDIRGSGWYYATQPGLLEPGETYYWRIRRVGERVSPWSRAIRFSVSPEGR